MEIITIDGMVEHDFRHSIEDMLRLDQVDEAIERLRGLLESCAGEDKILPARFLKVSCEDLVIAGWHRIADRLSDHDRPNHPISAIGVTLADPRVLGGSRASGGWLSPFLKTFYFSDDAYPFSDATRDDLLDGYSRDGFEWQGDYQATDATLSIKGIDDLYGAIIALEDRLFASPNPAAEEIRAGTIGACYLAALIHQCLRDTIRQKGLPRPLCILAACDGVYPFFDAPVAGSDESGTDEPAKSTPVAATREDREDRFPEDEEELAEEPPPEASLLSLVSRKGIKAPVIVLAEDDAREAARYSEMAGAQRLGMDEEEALKHLMECTAPSIPGDTVGTAGEAAHGEPDGPDDRAAPVEALALAVETLSRPLPDRAAPDEPWDDPVWLRTSVSNDRAAAALIDRQDICDGFLAPLEDPDALGADMAEVPVAAPASHSLRARINLAQPGPDVPRRKRSWALFDRFRRVFFG